LSTRGKESRFSATNRKKQFAVAGDGTYYSEKLFGDRTKKILRFLFDLKGRACTPEEEVSG